MDTSFHAPESFTTPHFTIRRYALDDGAALQEAVNESFNHLKPWMPWATANQTLEKSEANCRRFLANYLLNQDFTMGIWHGGELLGGTGFHLRWGEMETGNAEVGMWIRGTAAGQGLGTHVLEALLEWGFTEWPWLRLVWRCDTTNDGSIRVAQKNGLTLEGTFRSDAFAIDGGRRNTHLFAILKSDWEKARR
jgi:RimJ/RimL family protein N-acetyltransferase